MWDKIIITYFISPHKERGEGVLAMVLASCTSKVENPSEIIDFDNISQGQDHP